MRLFALPRFSLVVDRAADRVHGTGPSDGEMALRLDRCIPGEPTCYGQTLQQTVHRLPAATSTSACATVWSSTLYDAVGGEHFDLEWNSNQGDIVYFRGVVPNMQATIGSAKVTGFARPGEVVRLTLRSRHDAPRASASVTANSRSGAWSTRLRHGGKTVNIKVGDLLHGSLADDAKLRVRWIAAHVDLDTDNTHGRCYPRGMVGLKLQERGGSDSALAWGEAKADRSYGPLNESGFASVASGWAVNLFCGTMKNDVLHRHSVVP